MPLIWLNEDIWDGDGVYTAQEIRAFLTTIENKYGKKAKIAFEAGHNNVSIVVQPSKKVKVK